MQLTTRIFSLGTLFLVSQIARAGELPPSMPSVVFRVLDNYCIKCHADTSKDFGRLDMSKWVETPDGGMGFVHLDRNLKQRPSRHTFREVLDRIRSTDPDLHMPPKDDLKADDFAALEAWIHQQTGN